MSRGGLFVASLVLAGMAGPVGVAVPPSAAERAVTGGARSAHEPGGAGHDHLAMQEAEAENPSPEPHTTLPDSYVEPTGAAARTLASDPTAGGSTPFAVSSSTIGPTFDRQVHLFELPGTNKILSCAGSGNSVARSRAGDFTCQVMSWSDRRRTTIDLPDDWFCAVGVFDRFGKLYVPGGTAAGGYPRDNGGAWGGSATTYRFDPRTNEIERLGDMVEPRWYNNVVRNPFEEAFYTFGGTHDGSFSETWERMEPSVSTEWSLMSWRHRDYSYGDYKVIDEHHLAYTGASASNAALAPYVLDLRDGSGTETPGLREPLLRNGSASLLAYPAQAKKAYLFGGGTTAAGVEATGLVDMVDYAALPDGVPHYVPRATMPAAVMFVLATNLPNGQIFVTGGTRQWRTGEVHWAGLYTPARDEWTLLPPPAVGRNYHSAIYTRRDGRPVTFSGNPAGGAFESRSEIFTPWYKKRPQPTITASPSLMRLGRAYTVRTDFPQGTRLGKVTLETPRTTTHSASDPNYGLYRLPAERVTGGVRVRVPDDMSVPTGWFKLSVVTGGAVTREGASGMVPSAKSVWVRLAR